MKKNNKSKICLSLFILFATTVGIACSRKDSSSSSLPSVGESKIEKKDSKKISYYTCSMHPQIHSDHPGNCPICGMTLVPVYDEASFSSQAPSEMEGRANIQLSAEKQQLIGVKTELVTRKPLLHEIHTSGRVGYDPKFLVKQSDYLKIPSELFVYAPIYESDFPYVKAGTEAEIYIPGLKDAYLSKVEALDSLIDPLTKTAQARIKISNSSGILRMGMNVKVALKTQENETLSISNSALLNTGNHHIAFIDKGDGKFEPRNLTLGRRGSDSVEVLSGLSAGERIVTSANFLIDSESQLKSVWGSQGTSHD